MVGVSLAEQGVTQDPVPSHVSVKEAVFPFIKFSGVDIVLGPEMRSTGEVMGISERFSMAFAKSQLAAGTVLPREGNIFISVADRHKAAIIELASRLVAMGFSLISTSGTATALEAAEIPVRRVKWSIRQVAKAPAPMRAKSGQQPCKPACRALRRSKRRLPRSKQSRPCARKKCKCRRCRSGLPTAKGHRHVGLRPSS
jgi:hypothetical protein